MSEKVSQLLSKAKELIVEGNLSESLSICERILLKDGSNINALLMKTKCLMDLEILHDEVMKILNNILILKPKHPTAIQALRKFYQKNLMLFKEDAARFYYQLHETNELSSVDIDIICQDLTKLSLSPETEQLIIKCLLSEIRIKFNDECLRIFCDIAVEKYIISQNNVLLENLFNHLTSFNLNDESENVAYVRKMVTFVKNILDDKTPEIIYSVMTELSLKNVFTSLLFSRVLCNHYLMLDCEDNIVQGMDLLKKSKVNNNDALLSVLINIHFENLIHLGDIRTMEKLWLEVDIHRISKYLKCQAFAMGFNIFTNNQKWLKMSNEWYIDMMYHQQTLCRALMHEDITQDIESIHQILIEAELTSFEWYLWSKTLRSLGHVDMTYNALILAYKKSKIYFKVYIDLAEVYSNQSDYKMAVMYLEAGLERCFSQEMVEAIVDLNIKWKKYVEPIKYLEVLDVDHCSTSLLMKFVECFENLDKITDAISVIQRVVKKFPNHSEYWQLLGDLYLRRDNINHAYKTYQRCIQLSGETVDICTRLGNVFSLSFQDTFEENEFMKSVTFFDKSLDLGVSKEALKGKTSTLFVHAKMSLKQLMLTRSTKDINDILKLLSDYKEVLKDTSYLMNMLGKVLLLCIMGSIENLIDMTSVQECFFPNLGNMDGYDLSQRCFENSIQQHQTLIDSHFHYGILELFKLNKRCVTVKRGQILDPVLYNKIESHFKKVLSLDQNFGDAWKYLGYLYLRHGINTEKLSLDTQHCLSLAINLSCDIDRINDPETAFFLGLLYIRENWLDLAREVFQKIKIDYPINPIGYIGMYLLSSKDHTVNDQPEIAKALLSFVYKDESTTINNSYYQLNMSLVSLFAENMGFLVHSGDDNMIFNGQIEKSSLINALKLSLDAAWTKYLVYSAIGSSNISEEEKQLDEIGCFLGLIELILGNYQYGKKLVLKSYDKIGNQICKRISDILEINDLWAIDQNEALAERLKAISTLMNLKLNQESISMSKFSFSVKQMDEMLISAILDNLSSANLTSFTFKYANTLILACPFLLKQQLGYEVQMSILLALGSFIITLSNSSLACSFLQVISSPCGHTLESDDRLSRVICRLMLLDENYGDVLKYLYTQCLKQPFVMNRWLNLLEFGLEYLNELNGSIITIEKLFFLTYRPWCMTPLDYERYSRILNRFSHVITFAAINYHRLIFLKTVRLFPSACLNIFKNIYMRK